MHTQSQDNIDFALALLDSKLAKGWEWPDATAHAAMHSGVSYEDLADAYDRRDGYDRSGA